MLNKVILIGNLGKDPEVRSLPSGQPVATWTMATPGTYIISIKYSTKSIAGTPVPVPSTVTYTFTTSNIASTNASVLLSQ